jgi:SAM-dependent methyltransferase
MIQAMEKTDAADDIVRTAYSARSREYIDLFGSMTSTHPSDRALVGSWAHTLSGPVLDAGCGPGQWTDFLTGCGPAAAGIDLVPEFVHRARAQYPHLSFAHGSFETLDAADESLGGVLAWYSLIHHRPRDVRIPLAEFARVIRPGGGLLVGFFEGPAVEPFDHAATTAYRWPTADFERELVVAGFEVIETHTRTSGEQRPHGAIVARRRATDLARPSAGGLQCPREAEEDETSERPADEAGNVLRRRELG